MVFSHIIYNKEKEREFGETSLTGGFLESR
jgi:hypothetical protein